MLLGHANGIAHVDLGVKFLVPLLIREMRLMETVETCLLVVDGRKTVIGTFNLDPRSANLNTGCIVVVDSEQLAAGVLEGMEIEFQPDNAWEITAEFNPDDKVSRYKRVKTWTRKVLNKEIL